MLNGITTKKIIVENDNSVVVVNKSHNYDAQNFQYYESLLTKLISQDKLICDNYKSDFWKSYDEYSGYTNYIFDILKYKDELKCYLIIKKYYTPCGNSTLQESFNNIKRFILETNYLDINIISDYKERIKDFDNTDLRKAYNIKEFLYFINDSNLSSFLEELMNLKSPKSTLRQIPSYSSLLQFDNIITDFKINASASELNKYYPVLIWWTLSTIIPMRPKDLTILPKNCLLNNNNKFYITIERSKEDDNILKQLEVNKRQQIEITENVYNFLRTYEKLVSFDSERAYFFSYRFLRKHSQLSGSTNNPNILTRHDLARLLKSFLKNVVKLKYNYKVVELSDYMELDIDEIERPKLGDTRHLAFCSLMLQGFNPYTIATLGGHDSMESQLHYCNHLDSFVQSSIYIISKSLMVEIVNNIAPITHDSLKKSNIFKLSSLGDAFYELPKVPGGRCKSTNIPYDCISNECCFCTKHFVYDDNERQYLDMVNKKIESEIQIKLNFLKSVIQRCCKQQQIENTILEEFKTNSNGLKALINQKAIIDTYKLI